MTPPARPGAASPVDASVSNGVSWWRPGNLRPRGQGSRRRGRPWLLEAGLVSSGRREYPFRTLAAGAAFYPFDMALSGQDVGGNPRL